MALLVTVLLAAGALIGSFLLEWRHPRLETPEAASGFSGTPLGVAPDAELPRIRVEVLNGAGAVGAAKQVADRLRLMGFDVVYAGNAPSFDVPRSYLIDRSGRAGLAAAVADSAGIDSLAVNLSPELHLDATLVLGADWELLFSRRDSAAAPGLIERILKSFRD